MKNMNLQSKFCRGGLAALLLGACFLIGSRQTLLAGDIHLGTDKEEARFEAGKGTFLLDGKPFVIKAAALKD